MNIISMYFFLFFKVTYSTITLKDIWQKKKCVRESE